MQIIFSLIHLARRQRPEKQNSVETNRIHRVVTNNKLGFVNAEIKNDINGRGKKERKKCVEMRDIRRWKKIVCRIHKNNKRSKSYMISIKMQ